MGRKRNEKNWFKCKNCNEYVKRKKWAELYCTVCSHLVANKRKPNRKVYEKTQCLNCSLYFDPNGYNQKYCSDNCINEFKIKETNKKWLIDKPKVPRNYKKFAYSFFKVKKNQSWLTKYNVCRG